MHNNYIWYFGRSGNLLKSGACGLMKNSCRAKWRLWRWWNMMWCDLMGWDGIGWDGMLFNMIGRDRQERKPQCGLYLNLILASNPCMHIIAHLDLPPGFYFPTTDVFCILSIGFFLSVWCLFQCLQRLGEQEERIGRAAERISFAAATVAQKEVVMRLVSCLYKLTTDWTNCTCTCPLTCGSLGSVYNPCTSPLPANFWFFCP